MIFLGIIIFSIVIIFVLFQNLELITDNLFFIVPVLIILFLFAKFDFLIQLKDYERGVIFRLGKVNRVGGPGWTIIIPPFESLVQVDLRTKTVDIPPQTIVTKDNVEVKVDAVLYIKVGKDKASVINSVVEVADYQKASKEFVIGLIRNETGSLTLSELISKVDQLNRDLKESLERLSNKWGVVVEEVTLQNIDIPRTVIDAMHEKQASIQKRLAIAELAEADRIKIDKIREAAENLNDKAISYYYIKALEKLGEGQSTKFIFPLELTNLAKSLGPAATTGEALSGGDIEKLLKKYAPAIKGFVESQEAKEDAKEKSSKSKKGKKSSSKKKKKSSSD